MNPIIYFFLSMIMCWFIVPISILLDINVFTKKNLVYSTVNLIKKWFNFSLYKISKNKIIHKKNIIYLSNHTSFSDSIVDHITTNYCSKFISRSLVGIAFPFIWLFGKLTNSIIFFNRDKVGDIIKFFEWINIERKMDLSNNILVYPEGTRRPYALEPSALKKGFIYYSYDYNLPIQIIISRNKESIFNEKQFLAGKNGVIFTYYSGGINPQLFKARKLTREQYYSYVQEYWNNVWKKVYGNESITKYISDPKKYSYVLNNFELFENNIYNDSKIISTKIIVTRLLIYFILLNIIMLFL